MPLILFLVLGTIFLIRKGSDKARTQRIRNDFKIRVSECNWELKNFVAMYRASDELYYKATTDSCSSCGDTMRKRIESEVGITPSREMIVMALLAQECKIPGNQSLNIIENGISTAWRGDKETNYEYLRKSHSLIRFVRWYDNELCKNGFSHRLRLYTTDDYYRHQDPLFSQLKASDTRERELLEKRSMPLDAIVLNPDRSCPGGVFFWIPNRGCCGWNNWHNVNII